MVLNYEEIKNLNIIDNPKDSEFGGASYNLTVAKIIDMNNDSHDFFTLKPQGMAYVIFNEKINVPEDIIGFAHVKTSLTKRGVMATNIGILDPNYQGYISTLLINFGKNDYYIAKDDPGLRVTFSKMNNPKSKKSVSLSGATFDLYCSETKKNICNLDEKFLNLTVIEQEVKAYVFKVLVGLAIIFTSGSFLLSAYFNYKNAAEKDVEKSIKRYETDILTISESNKLIIEKLNVQNEMMHLIQDTLRSHAKELSKVKKQGS